MTEPSENWYAVRCVIRLRSLAETDSDTKLYEERITLWHAGSFDEAIAQAETEVNEYAHDVEGEYFGLAQAFHLAVEEEQVGNGDEIFSLIRDSELDPDHYANRFFDTGREHQGTTA